ncbi:MAG: Fur family transcriptional regulator [Finegoldia sp.]|nr:Fur family transcriptional regulator [Finegoldia sp.]
MNVDVLKQKLVEGGYKLTKQREIIFQTLLENNDKHLSTEELSDLVAEKDPEIGIATVYRTLMLFEELGLLFKLDFDDNRSRYELVDENNAHQHHHLLCVKCGKVTEVRFDLLDDMEKKITDDYGFEIKNHDLKFYGICSNCQGKDKEN